MSYSCVWVQGTAHCCAWDSVLKCIIDIKRGHVRGHRALQLHQSSSGGHQHLARRGRVGWFQSTCHTGHVTTRVSASTTWINNYLGWLWQPLLLGSDLHECWRRRRMMRRLCWRRRNLTSLEYNLVNLNNRIHDKTALFYITTSILMLLQYHVLIPNLFDHPGLLTWLMNFS